MSQTAVFPSTEPPSIHDAPKDLASIEVASMSRRFVAQVVDQLVLLVVAFVVVFTLVVATDGAIGLHEGTLSQLPAILIGLAYFAFVPAQRGARNGQTLGKRLLGVRVARQDGLPISRTTSVVRAIALSVPALMLFAVAAWIDTASDDRLLSRIVTLIVVMVFLADVLVAPLFGGQRRTLRDRVAGTVVLVAPKGVARPLEAAAAPPRPKSAMRIGLWAAATSLVALVLAATTVGGALRAVQETGSDLRAYNADMKSTALRSLDQTDRALAAVRGADFSEEAVAEHITDIATSWAGCLGSSSSPADCVTDDEIWFPEDTLDPLSLSALLGGDEAERKIGIVNNEDVGSYFLIYDRDGLGWGFRYTADARTYESVCVPSFECDDAKAHPAGTAFIRSQELVDQLISEHEYAAEHS